VKTVKMSLANLQGKMSRKEMKNIMAGSVGSMPCDHKCSSDSDCGSNCQRCHQTTFGKICMMYD